MLTKIYFNVLVKMFSKTFSVLLISTFIIISSSSDSYAAWVFPDLTQDVEDITVALSYRWDEVLTDAKSLATTSLTASSKLPKVSVTIMTDKTFSLDLSQYSDQARALSALVVLAGVLISFYIILS